MREQKFSNILNNGVVNLYRGCTHGCIYCDSRSLCYGVRDFENVVAKEGAVSQLGKELRKKKTKKMIRTGSMCDPYIPLEQKLNLTRGMLEEVYKQGFGICLLTKSSLVLRDLELLRKINERTMAIVEMTVTTFDDELCKIIEPNVSVTSERFETLKTLNNNGIETLVWISPILPFINDTEENIQKIVEKLGEIGTKRIIMFGFGVTLREGNREYFYKMLDKHFPGVKERYIKTFGYNYMCNSPNSEKLWEVFKKECERWGIIYDYNAHEKYYKSLTFKNQLSMF